MHAQKVAGRQGPGGLSGEMDPKTRAAVAAAANALFIFPLSGPPDGKNCPRQVKPYAHSQVAIRLDFRSKAAQVLNRPQQRPAGPVHPSGDAAADRVTDP
jgi:hypothetical protein